MKIFAILKGIANPLSNLLNNTIWNCKSKGIRLVKNNVINVIIVDDNREFCNILSDYLSNQKDIVITGVAKDGLEALDLIRNKNPDLVIPTWC